MRRCDCNHTASARNACFTVAAVLSALAGEEGGPYLAGAVACFFAGVFAFFRWRRAERAGRLHARHGAPPAGLLQEVNRCLSLVRATSRRRHEQERSQKLGRGGAGAADSGDGGDCPHTWQC